MTDWLVLIVLLGWILAGGLIGKVIESLLKRRIQGIYEYGEPTFNDILLECVYKYATSILAMIFFELGVEYLGIRLAPYELYFERFAHILSIFMLARGAAYFFATLASKKMPQVNGAVPTSSIITNIIRVTIYIGALVTILHSVGVSVAPALTALGVSGLAVALALQDTLSNLFAGLQLLVSKKIRPQDYVQLSSGEEGYIEDITWRNTTIRAISNHIVIVPNSKISTNILKNFNFPDLEVPATVSLNVSYTNNLEKIEQLSIEVASETLMALDGAVKDFTPIVRFNSFEDSFIKMTVIMRAKTFADQFLIRHEFIKNIHKRFQKENIEIPYPIRTVVSKHDDSGQINTGKFRLEEFS
ncbi:mechanosensitive ion channel family protein [Flectobacillus major]|uniref:mechanosensitive ion channel family protein n=1 Tax=Flectobacillus major TaxID=103 RepID=UPI0004129144|nr:mechanosensitive ion channel family protein [Flectobacillus major]